MKLNSYLGIYMKVYHNGRSPKKDTTKTNPLDGPSCFQTQSREWELIIHHTSRSRETDDVCVLKHPMTSLPPSLIWLHLEYSTMPQRPS